MFVSLLVVETNAVGRLGLGRACRRSFVSGGDPGAALLRSRHTCGEPQEVEQLCDNARMTLPARDPLDTADQRKLRGAFFTPPAIASYIAAWAVRSATDRVLEPSTGDAEFLTHAVERLAELGSSTSDVWGCELHEWSATRGAERVEAAGGRPHIEVGDFFDYRSEEPFDAVIGNPPYIRFQDFSGEQRLRARSAALQGGVSLNGLASAWAAFTVHAARQLKAGGRLGFVLPAELLSANYAAPVRRFLFEHFTSVELVLFEERVFPEAETEVVLLLAAGYREGTTEEAQIRQARNASDLTRLPPAVAWAPSDPSQKWAGVTLKASSTTALIKAADDGYFTPLRTWGQTRLGMVTGRNTYFALSPAQVSELGIQARETLPLSPPGSSHLRGLELSKRALTELGAQGKRTRLFYPKAATSEGAQSYIEAGMKLGVHKAYKCRVRRTWWQVPLMEPADLLLTYMNADTVRMVTNSARALHLNSVHGVYLHPQYRALGSEFLPLAALNSLTQLSAELTGRAYGGGILKMEPGEAAKWLVPGPEALTERARASLRAVRPLVGGKLRSGKLADATRLVDDALLIDALAMDRSAVRDARQARQQLANRREARSRGIQS